VWAAAALARVEPEDPHAIPALVAGTRDGIEFIRSLAAWHLGRLGPRHGCHSDAAPTPMSVVGEIVNKVGDLILRLWERGQNFFWAVGGKKAIHFLQVHCVLPWKTIEKITKTIIFSIGQGLRGLHVTLAAI
jgi:hypothetical protein